MSRKFGLLLDIYVSMLTEISIGTEHKNDCHLLYCGNKFPLEVVADLLPYDILLIKFLL